jgi:ATP dependent DNA ligase domain
MKIKDIFDEIANEPSTNKKMEILNKYKDNTLLRRVLYLANSNQVKFYIKKIPAYVSEMRQNESLEYAIDGLHMIINRTYTGDAAISWLTSLLSMVDDKDGYILERIIEKDCKIGMGTTNINKIFPNLIKNVPYMGARAFSEKIARGIFNEDDCAYSDIKMDGRYNNALIRSGTVELESRQGEPVTLVGNPLFLVELSKFGDCVLNGELTMKNKSRYESNGIIASLISIGKKLIDGKNAEKEIRAFEAEHMNYQEALDSIIYTVWDRITINEYLDAASNTPYRLRKHNLEDEITTNDFKAVKMIESKVVRGYQEAINHFKEMLKLGYEGTILKAIDGKWKDGKPSHQCKLKKEINLDLKVVMFNYGTGKNKDVISSIDVESSEGLLKTSPTGINESMMRFITENQDKLLNTILEVKCSGLSQDSNGNYSVLHPVFKQFRDDKNDANSLDECIRIDEAAMSL